MKNWYVIYVESGKEKEIVFSLKQMLDQNIFSTFVLEKEMIFRRSNIERLEKRLCFPSYVFVKSNCSSCMFVETIHHIKKFINGIIKILDYGEKSDIAMREKEIQILEQLYGLDYCLKHSVGIINKGKLSIEYGSLCGLEHNIKKINRHKKEALLEFELLGEKKILKSSLEITNKS